MRRGARFALPSLLQRIPIFGIIVCTVVIVSCSSAPESTVDRSERPLIIPPRKFPIPEGWTATPPIKSLPAANFQLVKNDNDASIAVRELRPNASAKNSLADEGICVLGNISMQNKLGDESKERRILRAPSVVGDGRSVCVYIYSENSLLRRVVVFRAKSAIYEVELLQNNRSLSFATVVDAQTALINSLMNGE